MPERKIVYRFFRPGKEDMLFEKGLLWFTPPRFLNDPFDLRGRVAPVTAESEVARFVHDSEHLKEVFRKEAIHMPPVQREKWISRRIDDYIKFFCKPEGSDLLATIRTFMGDQSISRLVGVLCFNGSEKSKDDLLFWSHYADGHKGYALKFNSSKASFRELGELRRVSYEEKREPIDPSKLIADEPPRHLFAKAAVWQKEQEYRIVEPLCDLKEFETNDKKTYYVRPMPIDSVMAVYFGMYCPVSVRKYIMDHLDSKRVEFLHGVPSAIDFRIKWFQDSQKAPEKLLWDSFAGL